MLDQAVFLERALIDEQLITAEQMQSVRRYATDHGVDLVDALIKTGSLDSRQISLIKADVCESPFVDLADYEVCFGNTGIVPRQVADRFCVFPLFMIDGVLTLGMDDPLNLEAADQVRQISKCEVDPVLCERQQLKALISRAYRLGHQTRSTPGGTDFDEDDGVTSVEAGEPVVAAVNQILADAAEQRASDIHINPDERDLHLRYRIDGVLRERQGPPLSMHAGIVQRLKVMAHLDLTQTRRPQDGKFRFRHAGQAVDVRMSTLPTVCGENVVLRLLAGTQSIHDFHELGVPAPMGRELEDILASPFGMLLVTGPTGSGKTTTLYTAISKLNDPSRNIMTIEDPVEIRLPYIRQIQAHPAIGLTFASALRSILRQDPDVVLVGEIRDNETATIALQAALTGHMVLSTVHTNDAVGAVARLRDYGLPSFVINSALLGVIAQRLVRRVCQHCAVPAELDESVISRFELTNETDGFVRGKGCGRCAQAGYRGRLGIYELFRFTSEIKRVVEEEGSTDRIREVATRNGMRLMWQDGLDKARLGSTTLEEVAKVASVMSLELHAEEERVAA